MQGWKKKKRSDTKWEKGIAGFALRDVSRFFFFFLRVSSEEDGRESQHRSGEGRHARHRGIRVNLTHVAAGGSSRARLGEPSFGGVSASPAVSVAVVIIAASREKSIGGCKKQRVRAKLKPNPRTRIFSRVLHAFSPSPSPRHRDVSELSL